MLQEIRDICRIALEEGREPIIPDKWTCIPSKELLEMLLEDVRVFLAFPGLYESRYKMPPNIFFEAVNRFERFKQELLQEALRDPYRHFGHPPGTVIPDEL